MRRLPTALALVATLVAGCGSTVQVRGGGPVQGGTGSLPGDGLSDGGGGTSTGGSAVVPDGSTPGTGPDGGVSQPTTGSGSGGTTDGAPGSTSGPANAPGSVVRGAESGRGFTRTTIRIGVGTSDDYNAFAGSFGLSGYSGNPNVWFDAVVKDINDKGGLLGRRIELVKHNYNTAQLLNDTGGANQAACTTWTQDKPVFAVLLGAFIVEDTLLACLAKADTPLVYPGAGLDYPLHYAPTYKKYPLFFNLAQMVGERFDRLAIGRLEARGFFTPWNTAAGRPGTATANPVKVGVLGFDDNDGAIQDASRKRELGKHGHQVAPEASIRCPRSLTAKIQCMQSAVLRFSSARVTHVIGTDLIFMQNAQSQGYHPRYYISVQAALYAQQNSESQLTGAMSEGYVPVYDVESSESPGDPSPATGACRALMRAAGQAATDGNTLALQYSICEEFNFTQAALEKAGALSATALRVGMESLGSTQPSALTFRSFLSPHEHTSARVLRDIGYDVRLGRFVYVSRTNYGDPT